MTPRGETPTLSGSRVINCNQSTSFLPASFALFVFAGVFKDTPLASWLPLDLTLVALLASMAAGLLALRGLSWRLPSHVVRTWLAMGVFSLWAAGTIAWSPGREYALQKSIHLVALCGWSVVGGTLIGVGGERVVRRFFAAVVVLGVLMSLAVIHLFSGGEVIAVEDWGNSYISFGRLLGLGVLCLFGGLLWLMESPRAIGFGLVALLLLLGALLLGGARGPLLSTVLAAGVALMISVGFRGWRFAVERRAIIASVGSLIAVLLVFMVGRDGVFLRTVQRLAILVSGADTESAGRRLWYAKEAWSQWRDAPWFGHGIGSWAHLLGWGDVRAYPHNIFLEVGVELGVVGLILVLLLCGHSWSRCTRGAVKSDRTRATLLLLLVASTANALISGDLPDNRAMFALLGIMSGYGAARAGSDG